jgi:chromosome segregation ATPase
LITLRTLEKKLLESESRAKASDSTIQELRGSDAMSKATISTLEEKLLESENRVEALGSTIRELRDGDMASKTTISRLSDQINAAERKIENFENLTSKLKEKAELQRAIDKESTKLINSFTQNLADVKEQLNWSNMRVEKLIKEKVASGRAMRMLEKENAAERHRAKKSGELVSELQKESASVKEKLSTSSRLITELNQENASMKGKLSTSSRLITELKQENASMKGKLSTLNALSQENASLKRKLEITSAYESKPPTTPPKKNSTTIITYFVLSCLLASLLTGTLLFIQTQDGCSNAAASAHLRENPPALPPIRTYGYSIPYCDTYANVTHAFLPRLYHP